MGVEFDQKKARAIIKNQQMRDKVTAIAQKNQISFNQAMQKFISEQY